MNGDSTWLWVLGLIAAGVVLLFLAGSETPATSSASGASTVSASAATPASEVALPPWAEAGSNLVLDERATVRLSGTGTDPAGRALSYHWVALGGRGTFDSANQARPLYTAPSVCGCEECVTLVLTVTDDHGLSASDSLTVRVRDPFLAASCEAPCASSCVSVASPCAAAKSSCGCVSPCAAPVPAPRCPSPARPCDSSCVPQVSAPEPARPTAVPCPCGGCGEMIRVPTPCDAAPCGQDRGPDVHASASAPCGKAVTPLISRQYPASVNEGGSVVFHATVEGPGCTTACYHWTADKGWFEDADSLTPVWHAPNDACHGGEVACIKLATTDSAGHSGYDQIRVRVNDLLPCSGTSSK